MVLLLSMVMSLVNLVALIFTYAIYASVILSWLIALNILDLSNKYVSGLSNAVSSIVDPVLNQIRKVIPPILNMDLSPVFALFGVYLIQYFMYRLFGFLV